jgi:cystathionine beta-synthase
VTSTLDIGRLRAAEAAGLVRREDLITGYVTEPLPAVGLGESHRAATARIGGHEAAWVLTDGRVTGLLAAGKPDSAG